MGGSVYNSLINHAFDDIDVFNNSIDTGACARVWAFFVREIGQSESGGVCVRLSAEIIQRPEGGDEIFVQPFSPRGIRQDFRRRRKRSVGAKKFFRAEIFNESFNYSGRCIV